MINVIGRVDLVYARTMIDKDYIDMVCFCGCSMYVKASSCCEELSSRVDRFIWRAVIH